MWRFHCSNRRSFLKCQMMKMTVTMRALIIIIMTTIFLIVAVTRSSFCFVSWVYFFFHAFRVCIQWRHRCIDDSSLILFLQWWLWQGQRRFYHWHPNTEKWFEKTRRSRVFFNQLRSVWISDETLFRVFDIASQSIDNSWRKSKQKFTEFYDN